jgi:hypothetical protein
MDEQLAERLVRRGRCLVRPLRDQRIKHIGQPENLRRFGDLIALEPAGVAAAVPPFMLLRHDGGETIVGAAERGEDPPPPFRMRADGRHLLGSQGPCFGGDRVGQRPHADIVQQTGQRQLLQRFRAVREAHADLDAHNRDVHGVINQILIGATRQRPTHTVVALPQFVDQRSSQCFAARHSGDHMSTDAVADAAHFLPGGFIPVLG